MITATIGTCNGCGLGVSLPHTAEFRPGARVLVFTEAELGPLLEPLKREIASVLRIQKMNTPKGTTP